MSLYHQSMFFKE